MARKHYDRVVCADGFKMSVQASAIIASRRCAMPSDMKPWKLVFQRLRNQCLCHMQRLQRIQLTQSMLMFP